jgi:stage II sporulation protein D
LKLRSFLIHFSVFVLFAASLVPHRCHAETRSTVDVRILEIFHPRECTVITPSDTFFIQLKGKEMLIDRIENPLFFSGVSSTVVISTQIKRSYRGTIKIYPLLDELIIINRVSIDRYLASIVGAEMGEAHPEAQKAQAIISRTYLFYNLKRHLQYDFCDLTHCQVYKGMETETEKAGDAVAETAGRLLFDKGAIAEIYYHSTCGGSTADYSSIFGDHHETLVSVSDSDHCSASPHFEWEWLLAEDEAPFQELAVSKRGADGRVTELIVDGIVERGWQFRMRIAQEYGWNKLKSSWFSVKKENGAFHFSGHGLGHGLGMCQWGAKKLAEEGKSAEEILRHYFPKLQLAPSK